MTGQEKKIKISELPASVTFAGLWTIGYQVIDGRKTSVRVSLSDIQGAYEGVLEATSAAREAAKDVRELEETARSNEEKREQFYSASHAMLQGWEGDEQKRKDAESGRVQSENERKGSELSRKEAETARAEAESIRESNELERQTAETDRKESESSRKEAEAIRRENEIERTQSETGRSEAELKRAEAELVRKTAENERVKAESARAEAEVIRDGSESERQAFETERQDSESIRDGNERQRIASEQERAAAESERQTAETKRKEAETERTSSEKARKIAETARKEASQNAVGNADKAAERANIAAGTSEELNAHPMKVQGGYWFAWNLESHDYVNTKIQAKGDAGSSFKIVGRYDTLEDLKREVPDGTDVDGVYAVGAEEPFDYYAWLVVDGTWQWDNQGKLRGAEGKSSYEVWSELPENEGKTLGDYFDWLSPLIDPVTGRWLVQGEDTGVQALGIDAEVTEKENTENSYVLHVKSAKGEFDTPNIRGISVNISETENTPDTYVLTFTHAKGTFTTPNLRGFDVKVKEKETNAPDDYRLEITTVEGTITTPNLKGRSGSAVIDIDHEPTEADTHYTYNGVQYAFDVGDEVRWYDKDSEEFVLFKLYAVTGTGAIWEEMGSGSGSLMTDVILAGPSDLSSAESDSYIYLKDGYLGNKEE